jgi:hypothetical protein
MFQYPFRTPQEVRIPVRLLSEFDCFYTPTSESYQAVIWSVLSRVLSMILPRPIRP